MFDDFLKNCPMEDEIKPSDKRIEKNIAALASLIGQEEKSVTKRKFRLKPLIIAAVIAILSGVSLLSASAAIQANIVNFYMGGEELEGEYSDYVDGKGFRHITFSAVLPMDEENYAVIFDVDAPQGENVRVITEETDPDFMRRLRMYNEAVHNHWRGLNSIEPKPEDFGLGLKDSELCTYEWAAYSDGFKDGGGGVLGKKFSYTGAASGKSSGYEERYDYDNENNKKTLTVSFYYYVGKEQTE